MGKIITIFPGDWSWSDRLRFWICLEVEKEVKKERRALMKGLQKFASSKGTKNDDIKLTEGRSVENNAEH